MTDDSYEVFAVRYASLQARTRRETFLAVDPHDSALCPIDYFVWVIRNAPRTIVPGHDPRVLERYPAMPGREGVIARLDVAPQG